MKKNGRRGHQNEKLNLNQPKEGKRAQMINPNMPKINNRVLQRDHNQKTNFPKKSQNSSNQATKSTSAITFAPIDHTQSPQNLHQDSTQPSRQYSMKNPDISIFEKLRPLSSHQGYNLPESVHGDSQNHFIHPKSRFKDSAHPDDIQEVSSMHSRAGRIRGSRINYRNERRVGNYYMGGGYGSHSGGCCPCCFRETYDPRRDAFVRRRNGCCDCDDAGCGTMNCAQCPIFF